MQTLFKSNLFSSSSSKVGAKNFVSGGKKLGSSIVGAARNNIIGFNRTAQAMVPKKKEENENSFIKNYTNFFGSKKTEKILRKNLKLVRDSLVNTFEIARYLKAAIVDISKGLKGKGGGLGGLFGGLGGLFGFLGGLSGIIGGLAGLLSNPLILAILGAGTILGVMKLIFGDGEVETFIRKYVKDILAGTILPGANDNPNTNNLAMDDLIEDVGESRALAVLEGRMEELKEQRGLMRGNYFSEENQDIRDLEKQIDFLKGKGVVSADMSGEQYESDLANFSSDTQTRKELKEEFHEEKEKSIRDVRLRRENEMPKHIRESMNKSIDNANPITNLPDFHPDVKAYLKETRRQVLEAEEEIRKQYLPTIKGEESSVKPTEKKTESIEGEKSSVKSTEKKDEVTSDNTLQDQNVEGVKSDLNTLSFAESLKMAESGKNFLTFEPITFGNASDDQSTSGGDVTSTSSGGTTGGDAVTFYSSSNPDSSYHKLNAMVTFNIV